MQLLRFNPAEIVAVRYGLSQTTLAAAKAFGDAGGAGCMDTLSSMSSSSSGASVQVALTLLPPAAGQKLGLAEQMLAGLLQQGQIAALQQQLKLQAESEVPWAPSMQQAAHQALAVAALHLSRCGLAAELLPLVQFASLEAAPQEGQGGAAGGAHGNGNRHWQHFSLAYVAVLSLHPPSMLSIWNMMTQLLRLTCTMHELQRRTRICME